MSTDTLAVRHTFFTILLLMAVSTLLYGCFEPKGMVCPTTGRICPDKCSPDGNSCYTNLCGNGVVDKDDGETCDDGNKDASDDCTNTCAWALCGDGIVQKSGSKIESCDNGQDNGSTCNLNCTSPACGDGFISDQEECDNHTQQDSSFCNKTCKIAKCGDGYTNEAAGEVCDDGNTLNGDYCSADCKLSKRCGNGNLDKDEECDDNNNSNEDACLINCVAATCGDGYWNESGPHPEECDPSAHIGPVLCTSNCKIPKCNDGIVTPEFNNEECDPPGTRDNIICSNSCQIVNCGNKRIDEGEKCDDGNQSDDDACLNTCKEAFCGDGHVRANSKEECDDGAANGKTESCPYGVGTCNTCTSECKLKQIKGAYCGDGIINDSSEDCDTQNSCTRCVNCKRKSLTKSKGEINLDPENRPNPGDVITIGDGTGLPVTFRIQETCPNRGFSCDPQNNHQPYCCVEMGTDNYSLADNLALAIARAQGNRNLRIEARSSALTITLVHESYGALGNQTINTTNPLVIHVSGLSGGTGYSCPSDSACTDSSDCLSGLACTGGKCQ